MARSIGFGTGDAEALAWGAGVRGRGFLGVLERRAVVVLLLALAALGMGLRAGGVGHIGFAEDEINKLEAVRAYGRGDITENAEHPMLMKALIFASMSAAREWNERVPPASRISDEAALRFPNVLFGALTVFPIFLLAARFFGRRTAFLAAAFWATGVSAMTYNRTGKEDTLLVFFMLFAFYFYIRAKQTSGFDPTGKRLQYILSGASFGFMLASKYFPHYLGLNMLFHHFARLREREPGEPHGSTPTLFYLIMAAAFFLANPALLAPQTWGYLNAYSNEQLLTHHGYLMGEQLYDNVMSKSPFGATPVYFYALFLLLKTPLPLLFALVAGLVTVGRCRREPGPSFVLMMFLLWLVPFSLAGAKWLRYTLALMPFVYIIAAVGAVALVKWCASLLSRTRPGFGDDARPFLGAAAVALFILAPAWAAYRSMPHYALYTNALAPHSAGYFFPHDEFYDDGLREAIRYVCERAPRGATVAHETPGVAGYYLEQFGRTDLRSRVISDPDLDVRAGAAPLYVIVQRGRTYFENREELEAVRAASRRGIDGASVRETSGSSGGAGFTLEHEVVINGVSAVEVYARDATMAAASR